MNSEKLMYWHNGIFLKPHHFQHAQSYAQNIANNFNKLNSKNNWGIVELELDESRLNNYELSIKRGEFLFRDNTIINYPDNAILDTRDFSEFIKDKNNLKCYLGVKKLNKSKSNVTIVSNEDDINEVETRFVFNENKSNLENNLYEDDDKIDIPYLDFHLKILFEDEINTVSNYELLPFVVIRHNKGNISLSDAYSPPLVNLFADENLKSLLHDIHNHLFSYVGRLEESKALVTDQSSNAYVQKKIMILYALSEFIPILESHITYNSVHPWDIYITLLRLISKLSAFSNMIDVRSRDNKGNLLLGNYDHNDLFACFNNAGKLIIEVLNSIDTAPDLIADFEYSNDRYSVSVPEKFLDTNYDFYIGIRSEQMSDVVRNLQFLKIAGSQRIVEIVGSSLPGLSFKKLNSPPFGLSKDESTLYIKLQTTGDEWLNINNCKDISLSHGDLAQGTHIQLIIISK